MEFKIPKKLIEVALPLDDINEAAAREKSIRHGHPSTLHLWWARRPLAAARAVIFAQMVNDPGYQRDIGYGVNKKEAEVKREHLFKIIRDLVKWENTTNEEVINRAKEAIRDSWLETCKLNKNHPKASILFNPGRIPEFHDPFAGGGAIPLEAQRLGLKTVATDLNPVAVIINKAMLEIPVKFRGLPPVGPNTHDKPQKQIIEDWSGSKGLAEDVRRYGYWMRNEAFRRIGHLYPTITVTTQMVNERPDLKAHLGEELTVLAWLWCRTVKSSNPAFGSSQVPLVSSFVLSSKKGAEAYVEPIINGAEYSFEVRLGKCPNHLASGTKSGRGASFSCLLSNLPMTKEHIRGEISAKRSSQRLLAVVTEGQSGRIYLSPKYGFESTAAAEQPSWKPEVPMNQDSSDLISGRGYGFSSWYEIFTQRQLVALSTFHSLALEARKLAINDFNNALKLSGRSNTATDQLDPEEYGNAILVYLTFAINKGANLWSTITSWMSDRGAFRETFARQAIPMVWDFAEANPFSNSGGSLLTAIDKGRMALEYLPQGGSGEVYQQDAATQVHSANKVISTDPPYYDNIGYADLSDFFYVWMRPNLKKVYPNIFATLAVPKTEELVATAYRHGGKKNAESFFLEGMTKAMSRLAEQAHPAFPVSIYYAFKQAETKDGSTSSTGWETFLEAVIRAGFSIDGTWPVRTEGSGRLIAKGTNALASSVVLVCKKRAALAEPISRRDFQRELRETMPEALEAMIGGETGQTPIAPVDLAQASIGPGMAVFSKYDAVLNQDGSRMSVHDALILINRSISEYLNPDSGNFDSDTLFCDDWFNQYGWSSGAFGDADLLSKAKGTSVDGIREAGVIESGGGKVRLLKWSEYPSDWDPRTDDRTPVWEACHQMIRALNQQSETSAGSLLARMPEQGEPIRQLAYHLYTLCERKKWAEDARAYNELIGSWHAIVAASNEAGHKDEQIGLEF